MDKTLQVLLIEDSPSDARLVEIYLRQSSLDCHVHHVETLAEAGGLATQHTIDVVLLDLSLPDSSGIDTFRVAHKRDPEVPIVVLSGQSDNELAITAVREGAQDYLPKSEFSSSSLTRSIRYAIERHDKRRTERRLLELEQDAQAAAIVQQQLLPQTAPKFSGFDIAARCVPAAATGGDFYDFFNLCDGRQGILIADVSGHGLGPALIMASARRVLRSLRDYHADLGELFTAANRDIVEDTASMHFVTAFLAVIDPEQRTLQYTSAGHDAWLLRQSGEVETLDAEGLPLGIVEDEVYRSSSLETLLPGETLFLLTDGIAEAQRHDHSMFTTESVKQTILKLKDRPAEEIIDGTLQAASEFCQPAVPRDDMTMVVIKLTDR